MYNIWQDAGIRTRVIGIAVRCQWTVNELHTSLFDDYNSNVLTELSASVGDGMVQKMESLCPAPPPGCPT